MSIDYSLIPASIERDAAQYAEERHITTEEAFVEIFSKGLKAVKGKAKTVAPITEDELKLLDAMFPGLSALDDVTDEQWDRIGARIRRMKREGLAANG